MRYLDLETIKRHLNVEQEFTDDDALIEAYADAAEERVAKELCTTTDGLAGLGEGGTLPAPLKQAILLLVGAYYAYREEVTDAQTRPLEQGARHLMSLYRDYSK